MGRKVMDVLYADDIFICRSCETHLTRLKSLSSKNFTGRLGQPAYLFATVVNVTFGEAENQNLSTGLHTIKKVYCAEEECREHLGWTYTDALMEENKYKIGKVCLERSLIRTAFN